jgi:hypothetical protein
MPTKSKRFKFLCVIAAISSACLAIALAFFLSLPHLDRTRFKKAVFLPISESEKLELQVSELLKDERSLTFRNQKLTAKGDMCGEISIAPDGALKKFERFMYSPGNFFEFGDKGLVGLDGGQYKQLELGYRLAVAFALGWGKENFNREMLYAHWSEICGEELPVTVAVSARREVIKKMMKDPDSAVFRNERLVDGKYCGEYNAKNSMGGMVGFRRFYFIPGAMWQADESPVVPLVVGGIWLDDAMAKFKNGTATEDERDRYFASIWKAYCGA